MHNVFVRCFFIHRKTYTFIRESRFHVLSKLVSQSNEKFDAMQPKGESLSHASHAVGYRKIYSFIRESLSHAVNHNPHLCATPKPSHADLPVSHRIPEAGHLCYCVETRRLSHGGRETWPRSHNRINWIPHTMEPPPPITQSDPHQTKLNEFECQKDRKRNRCYNRRVKRKGCPN